MLWRTTGVPTHEEQLKLTLDHDQDVTRFARTSDYADGIPAFELVTLALHLLPYADGNSTVTDLNQLAVSNKVTLGKARETVSHVPADGIVARHLGIKPTATIMRIERIVETRSCVPLEWRITFFQRNPRI